MKLLLDTHAFLWFVGNDPQLSGVARTAMADPNNELLLSMASCWEMAIKTSKNKLALPAPIGVFIQREIAANAIHVLEIDLQHVLAVSRLPYQPNHNDPFDRLLIAQAIVEAIPLVSNEAIFDAYPITRLW